MGILHHMMRALPFAVMVLYIVLAPYTKVEESFNMQAMHDLLYLPAASVNSTSGNGGGGLSAFDHHAFPGVVPRTFFGAIFVAAAARPFIHLVELFRLFDGTRLHAQFICRLVLGLASCASLDSIAAALGGTAGALFSLFCASQFHLMFYASRPLPNTFAFILVQFAVAACIRRSFYRALFLLGCAAAVFRSDVCVLIAPLVVVLLWNREINFAKGAATGLFAVLLSLLVTIPVDSFFWRRALWPEGAVLWFNTYMNKSSEWGTQPFLWYFYSVVPRGLGFLLPCFPVAVYTAGAGQQRYLQLAAFGFLLLYSFLPHKELRFVLLIFPTLFVPIANWASRTRRMWFVLCLCVLGNFAFSAALCSFSIGNYPGGAALEEVHRLGMQQNASSDPSQREQFSVYIDAFACMNGVTRFGKRVPSSTALWQYSKDPELFNRSGKVYTAAEWPFNFSYLIVRHGDKKWHQSQGQYEHVMDIETFESFSLKEFSQRRVKFLSIFQQVKQQEGGSNSSTKEGGSVKQEVSSKEGDSVKEGGGNSNSVTDNAAGDVGGTA